MARRAKEQERPNVNPDDVAACYAEYSGLRADQARLNQRIQVTLGRYEKLGVDPVAIKHAYTVAAKDPREAAAQHKRNSEYLALLEIIRFDDEGQGNFVAGLTVAKPSQEASAKVRAARAHADGYNSGLAGGTADGNPFAAGSAEFVQWIHGHSDGRADRIAKRPEDENVVAAVPRRRGRPPKTRGGDDIGETFGSA